MTDRVVIVQPGGTLVVREPQVQTVTIVAQGPQGPRGDPGITVSPTAPINPQVNDLWLQTS